MAEYTNSSNVAKAGLTTGIIGSALGAINSGLLNGGGILGGMPGGGCSEDHCVNRYEAGQQARIAELETEVKLRDSNIYTDSKMLEMYKYFDGELRGVRETLCGQAVMNQKTADSFDMVKQDIVCTKNELYTAIARERDERCCGDNALANYVNATFYPRMTADITTAATTTAQALYNPVQNCCCK